MYNEITRVADVALIVDDNIKYIFEICFKHKTDEENRPEPWFEISTEEVNNYYCNQPTESLKVQCLQLYTCPSCIDRKLKQEEKHKRLVEETERQVLKQREENIKRRELEKKREEEQKRLRDEQEQKK